MIAAIVYVKKNVDSIGLRNLCPYPTVTNSLRVVSHPVFVVAAGSNGTIGIALREFSVSDIISIYTFNPLSVLSLLYSLTVTQSVVICSAELAAVGIVDDNKSLDATLTELSFKNITGVLRQLSLSVLNVIFPLSGVLVTILPHHLPHSTAFSVEEMAGVGVAVTISEDSLASPLPVEIITLIAVAVGKCVNTFSVLGIVFPLPLVFVAGGKEIGTVARPHIIDEVTVIFRTVAPVEDAFSILLVVVPLTIVVCSRGESVLTSAAPLVLLPVSIIRVAVRVLHYAVALLIILIPQSVIGVAVLEVVDTTAMLLVLKPLSDIFLSIREGVGAFTLSLSLLKLTLVNITIGINSLTFAPGLTAEHLASIASSCHFTCANNNLLCPHSGHRQHDKEENDNLSHDLKVLMLSTKLQNISDNSKGF